MTAPVVDLTPQDADYSVLFFNGMDSGISMTSGVPLEVTGDFSPLYGAAPIAFKISPNNPPNGSMYFKKPPTAISCELVKAEVLTKGIGDAIIPIDVSKYVFIANDGRVIFRKNVSHVIMDALVSTGVPVDAYGDTLTGFKITAHITPVYQNPTGETPEFPPFEAIVQWAIDGSDFLASRPVDYVDERPYINYTYWTTDTPATIAPGVMPD